MTSPTSTPAAQHIHVLSGLDGSNLLAFMAAIGALRLIDAAQTGTTSRLRWEHRGTWTPILETELDRVELVEALAVEARKTAAIAALSIGDDIKLSATEFRGHRDAFDSSPDRDENLAWLAAFASDACIDRNSKDGLVEDTEFRTMQGAGHQHFLKSIRANLATASKEDLDVDLLGPWRYDRDGAPLRWDPADDRQHAYRWRDPSGDKSGAVPGALALASAALAAFPTFPTRRELRSTGFTSARGGPLFTWPIWSAPLSLRASRSLLGHPHLQQESPARRALASLGVTEVFRCRRKSVGKMRNFTPAWNP